MRGLAAGRTRCLVVLAFVQLLAAGAAHAQGVAAADQVTAPAGRGPLLLAAALPQDAPDSATADCAGCPPRRVGTAFALVTAVNGMYGLVNLARGEDFAKVTPKTWWTNMKRGWTWDSNPFVVNQIGHPYQGNNYFTSARASGLNYWESAALTAFGSGTWEYFGETHQASFNDFLNTTLGGMALGEMLHRTAWLIRDPESSDGGRRTRELLATALDPMSGLVRFVSGDASRTAPKPRDLVPTKLGVIANAGALWRGSNTETIAEDLYPFIETDLLYGDINAGTTHTPYDAFAVRLGFGGGSAISEVRVLGRLFSMPMKRTTFMLAQGYQFTSNPAYQFGAQSFSAHVVGTRSLTSRASLLVTAWGGATVLGAIDSIAPEGVHVTADEEAEEETRTYDYGPGSNLGTLLIVRRDGRDLATFSWELHHLYVLDGIRANHLLQRARLSLQWPLSRTIGIGTSGEFFHRQTFYHDNSQRAKFEFPQVRLFLTWTP